MVHFSVIRVKGSETEIAASGTEALQLFEEYSPDLVLLDVMLPGMDGYQVCTAK